MLFNSYVFLLLFLPVSLAGFHWSARLPHARVAWLVACSLFFYAWWHPPSLVLLLASIALNFAFGAALGSAAADRRGWILGAGVAANLSLLAYYKYANFALATAADLWGATAPSVEVVLPLGISFFTFTQIAYLADAARGDAPRYDPLRYALFVSFFPHLIAGPILHHKDIMPQFEERLRAPVPAHDVSIGLTILVIGMAKKVLLADPLAAFVGPTYAGADLGATPSFAEAWLASLAYTLQLYFDFSGYSDMAIGLSRMFGVRMPLNFDSPYQARSIADFWRRWHMTLSRFLRDYLYVPLGGNRHGSARRYLNLLVTMLLGGLWHGAGWSFVAWGGLHGALLALNHGWRALRARLGVAEAAPGSARSGLGRIATFLCVVAAWVLFRAGTLDGAGRILGAMAGLGGFDTSAPFEVERALRLVAPLLLLVWFAPNTQQILADYEPALDSAGTRATWLRWRPTRAGAIALAVLALVTLLNLSRATEFLYYQF